VNKHYKIYFYVLSEDINTCVSGLQLTNMKGTQCLQFVG